MTQPPHEISDRLRAAFADACAAQEVRGGLVGPPERMELAFEAQENAEPALLDELFRAELDKTGVTSEQILSPPPGLDVAAAEAAISCAVGRLRTLLIELNSYLSGGLPWVFPGGVPSLRSRGLAAYRYPKLAEVDIVAEADHLRIAFHPGDLGKVTSSGFYVPTRLRGDFTATARYRLRQWHPGSETACFGLFTQDEPSQLRYYTQLRGVGAKYRDLMANFNNQVMTEPRLGAPDEGGFRLRREGDLITAWHRGDGDWLLLGEHRGDPVHDMILGCKIWSSGTAGALEAELHDLEIEAEVPEDQIPVVPTRPDPRHG